VTRTVTRQIITLVGKSPQRVFSCKDIRDARRPVVYVWMRAHSVEYVGMGPNGVTRPLSHDHHVLRAIGEVRGARDRVLVFACASKAAAAALEVKLIRALQPKRNGQKYGPFQEDAEVEQIGRIPKYQTVECPTCHKPHALQIINGFYLRHLRRRAQIDARHFVIALGITRQFLSKIETNKSPCPERIRVAYERLGDTVTPRTRQ
jgi:hypothetical protein